MDKKKRYSEGERVTLVGVAINFILAVLKFTAGIMGRSEAMIADAVHSLSDLLTDAVVLVSLRISRRPVDESRPYGYGRVETVGTGIIGIVLIAVAAGIFWDSVQTIHLGIEYIPTHAALLAAAVSIIVKEGMYRYTVIAGKRIGSPSIIANAWHHRSDAFSSIASLVGIAAAMMGWPIFDPLAALVVTILILKVGWKTAKDSLMDIIDTAVRKDIRDRIIHAALETPGVLNYHDLKTRKMGSEILADIHIEVNPWMNVSEAHSIADAVKDAIMKKDKNIADVLVHIDPEGEVDGIVYTTPKHDIIEKIRQAATSMEGVDSCEDIMLHFVGNDIIVTLTVGLSSALTLKEGHARVAETRERILDIERVKKVVVSVGLH